MGETQVMAKSASAGESSASKSLLFMMIAMTCGVCILVGGGFLMTSRLINTLALRNSSDKATVRTPLGDFMVDKAKEIGPTLPVYPASTLVLPGTQAARLPSSESLPQVVTSNYHTNSSREYVANWYAEHLSPEFVRQDSGPKNLPEAFRESHISEDDIAFVGERGDQIRVVVLGSDSMGTKIALLRSAKEAAH
jgi:hypothetical protein